MPSCQPSLNLSASSSSANFNAIGVSRILKILKRESYTKSKRPASGDFLYFWFFGVDPDFQDGNAARDLKEYIFNLSEKENLPIYLETSVEKNKRVYLKFGFEIYHTWKLEEQGLELYFMRKEPFK